MSSKYFIYILNSYIDSLSIAFFVKLFYNFTINSTKGDSNATEKSSTEIDVQRTFFYPLRRRLRVCQCCKQLDVKGCLQISPLPT